MLLDRLYHRIQPSDICLVFLLESDWTRLIFILNHQGPVKSSKMMKVCWVWPKPHIIFWRQWSRSAALSLWWSHASAPWMLQVYFKCWLQSTPMREKLYFNTWDYWWLRWFCSQYVLVVKQKIVDQVFYHVYTKKELGLPRLCLLFNYWDLPLLSSPLSLSPSLPSLPSPSPSFSFLSVVSHSLFLTNRLAHW